MVKNSKEHTKTVVFAFGSNLAGRHGKGAAYYAAKYYGAEYGKGEGLYGNSYAIPTKDAHLNVLELKAIREYLRAFLKYAAKHEDTIFLLTPIGSGLAGYRKTEIANLLHDIGQTGKGNRDYKATKKPVTVPSNVVFTKEWFDL